MRQTRFARGSAATCVALPLCLLFWSDQIDGLFTASSWILFAALTATLYCSEGMSRRVRACHRGRESIRAAKRAA